MYWAWDPTKLTNLISKQLDSFPDYLSTLSLKLKLPDEAKMHVGEEHFSSELSWPWLSSFTCFFQYFSHIEQLVWLTT